MSKLPRASVKWNIANGTWVVVLYYDDEPPEYIGDYDRWGWAMNEANTAVIKARGR